MNYSTNVWMHITDSLKQLLTKILYYQGKYLWYMITAGPEFFVVIHIGYLWVEGDVDFLLRLRFSKSIQCACIFDNKRTLSCLSSITPLISFQMSFHLDSKYANNKE